MSNGDGKATLAQEWAAQFDHAGKLRSAWSARKNIMFTLFDICRLMTDDEKKLQAMHNEIANLCNKAYEKVEADVKFGVDEDYAFQKHFGYTQRNMTTDEADEPQDDLRQDLHEFIFFMYEIGPKTNGFLRRATDLIDLQYKLHYR